MKVGDGGGLFAGFSHWTGDEEETLLDVIEQHGFGNWYALHDKVAEVNVVVNDG